MTECAGNVGIHTRTTNFRAVTCRPGNTAVFVIMFCLVIIHGARHSRGKRMHRLGEMLLKQVHYTQENINAKIDSEIEAGNAAGFCAEYVQLLVLEKQGGPCTRCGKPWRKMTVKNLLADFSYYAPACTCFPICSRCGSSLHREAALSLPSCTSCGYRKLFPSERSINDYSKKILKKY
jgi:DNA-directed RNA polymerase subunit RPC12/RpoP